MQRFVLRCLLFAGLQVPIILLVLQRGEPRLENSYFLAIEDKLSRLHSIEGPRIIIIGGSSAAFGIDSDIVAEGLHGTPVNFGLHAGLGIDFYLRLIEPHVRADDTIVITPEYELLALNIDEDVQRQMAIASPRMRPFLFDDGSSFSEFKRTLDRDALRHAHEWTYRAFRKHRASAAEGVYSRSSFDIAGDMTEHYQLTPVTKSAFLPIHDWESDCLSGFISRLNEFASSCKVRGARVYFSYAPIDEERFQASRDTLVSIDRILREQIEFVMLDHPSDQVFQQDQFYDSYYHLCHEAVLARSNRMNDSLRARTAVRDSTETIIR